MRDPKAVALESVMRHPELSKLLKDAHGSPQGSTLRKKARAVLKSTYQASYNKYKPTITMDGQGGPGPTGVQNNFIPPSTNGGDLSTLSLGQPAPAYSGTLVVKSPFKAPTSTISLDSSGSFAKPAEPQNPGLNIRGNAVSPSGMPAPISSLMTPPGPVIQPGLNANMAPGEFMKGVDSISPAATKLRAQTVKDAEKSAWQKAFGVYNTQTNIGQDAKKVLENRKKQENLQNDIRVYQKALQGGTNWGTVWNSMHAKYPELGSDVLDGLLQKGNYYIDGKWVPPKSPTSQFSSVAQNTQAATQPPAPVFKVGLSDAQKKSITSLIQKITGSGYTPNANDIKNLTYALGPNWQQFTTAGQDPRVNTRLGAVQAVNGPGLGPTASGTGASTAQTMANYTSVEGEDGHTHGPEPMAGANNETQGGGIQDFMLQKWQEGVGPESAINIAMNDKALVAQALGVPIDSLPDSLLLGDQYQEVEDALRKQYNLNNLENEILTRQRNGKNLDSVLEDYMTERDTYINTINNTMDNAKAWFNARGADNPYAVQSRDRYMGFLTTLKGGQQKRYADFLKMSTDMYGQETQALTDSYNIQKQEFENRLANSKLATQEEYNTMKSTLKGMYDRYDTIIDRQKKIADLNSQGILVAGQTAEDIISNSGSMLSTQMKDAETLQNWAPTAFSHLTIKGQGQGAEDIILYNEPIASAMQRFADNSVTEAGRAGEPTAVIEFYDKNIGSTMDKSFSIDNFNNNGSKIVNNYQNLIDQYLKNAYGLAGSADEKKAVLENAQKLAKTLGGRVEYAAANYLENENALKDVQKAIQELAYEHKWIGKDKARTAAEVTPQFIENWKKQHANVPKFILDSIASAYNLQTNVKGSNGQPLHDGPAEAFLMYQDPNNPNNVSYYKPEDMTADYLAWNVITKGALAQLAQDSLI